ncbi:MAG: hypothetical protein ACRDLT_10490 [Solirubrobacteraceae bacterium]
MSAELQISRSSRLADAAWRYQIVLDGQDAGMIRNGETAQLSTSPGEHTLQVRSLHIINRHIGLASPPATFAVNDGKQAQFVCQAPSFAHALPQWITCLRGDRSQWIKLEPVTSLG